MPIYVYKCEKCNLTIEENRKVEDRDDLTSILIAHCPLIKAPFNMEVLERACSKTVAKEIYSIDINCNLKRIPTSGSFKI